MNGLILVMQSVTILMAQKADILKDMLETKKKKDFQDSLPGLQKCIILYV